MNPPESTSHWNFNEVSEWLSRHPDVLEPGLKLMDRGLDLGHGLEVPFCGIDPLGHPCLVLYYEEFGAKLLDQLFEIVVRMHTEGARFQPLFPRSTEPRIFLIAPSFDLAMHQRLALLSKAFPLRAFLLQTPLRQETAPQLIPELLEPADAQSRLVAALADSVRPLAHRLLAACDALHPRVRVHGGDWPLVFRGNSGPCATLFMEQGKLWFVNPADLGSSAPWQLHSDEGVDRAIDVLMRSQGNCVSPAA